MFSFNGGTMRIGDSWADDVRISGNAQRWWRNVEYNTAIKWAAIWQNQQNDCAPSEDSDQLVHSPNLIRVFTVRMKKAWVLSYPLSAQRRLWSDWAHSHFVGFVMSRLTFAMFESETDFCFTPHISRLVPGAWCGIRLYRFLIIAAWPSG